MAVNSKSPKSLSGSSSMFDTFGNEASRRVDKSTLVEYLKNSTINFPIPEASTSILSQLADADAIIRPINSDLLGQVVTRLIKAGYQEANARAMADILMQTAEKQGVSPLTYFEVNENTIKLTSDTYDVLNALMPPGNRISITIPKNNLKNKKVYIAK